MNVNFSYYFLQLKQTGKSRILCAPSFFVSIDTTTVRMLTIVVALFQSIAIYCLVMIRLLTRLIGGKFQQLTLESNYINRLDLSPSKHSWLYANWLTWLYVLTIVILTTRICIVPQWYITYIVMIIKGLVLTSDHLL